MLLITILEGVEDRLELVDVSEGLPAEAGSIIWRNVIPGTAR